MGNENTRTATQNWNYDEMEMVASFHLVSLSIADDRRTTGEAQNEREYGQMALEEYRVG